MKPPGGPSSAAGSIGALCMDWRLNIIRHNDLYRKAQPGAYGKCVFCSCLPRALCLTQKLHYSLLGTELEAFIACPLF
jgi:hypothetical protein